MLKPSVYEALADHQQAQESQFWSEKGLMDELHRWKAIFDCEFKLETPPVAFAIKCTRANCLGYFRPGHNDFGVKREIAISRHHLYVGPRWDAIGTLLHELLHAWQDMHGKAGRRNYHNDQLRAKAITYGLIINPRGVTTYAPQSLFMDLLDRHGVQIPAITELATMEDPSLTRNNNKMKRWQCRCGFGVRVAVSYFHARCLTCGQQFEKCA